METDILALEGVAPELAPSDFMSQNYEALVALMQEEAKRRTSQSLQARLNFSPEYEASPPRHQRRGARRIAADSQCSLESGRKL